MSQIIKRENVTVDGYGDGSVSITIDGFSDGCAILASGCSRVHCSTHMTIDQLRALCEAGLRVVDAAAQAKVAA